MGNQTRTLLAAGYFVPVVYFANLLTVGALTPGFDHAVHMPSELGRDGAPFATLFNTGLIVVAVLSLIAAWGLWVGLRQVGKPWLLAVTTWLCLSASAIALAMAGLYPLPHPLHYGFGMSVAAIFIPLSGAIATRGPTQWMFLVSFAVPFIYLAAGFAGIANESNFGIWIRAVAGTNFLGLVALCRILHTQLRNQN